MFDRLVKINNRIELEFGYVFTPYGNLLDKHGIQTGRLINSGLLNDVESVLNKYGFEAVDLNK